MDIGDRRRIVSVSVRKCRPLITGGAAAAALALVVAPVAHGDEAEALPRIGGDNRYETAVAVSQSDFEAPGSADAVVLARADEYADALSGGALAAAVDAPLLLTQTDRLPAATQAEIERVLSDGGTVHILGGASAVSTELADEIEALGYNVNRLAGEDRYETAIAIAEEIGSEGPLLLSTGTNFPDALTSGAAAGSTGGVVLLTRGDALPSVVVEYLEDFEGEVYAVGGPAVTAASALDDVVGVEGNDRYETAVAVAEEFFHTEDGFEEGYDGFALASGQTFPDALTGGASSGRNNDPVLLAQQNNLPNATAEYLTETAVDLELDGHVLGGPRAISDAVAQAAFAALNPPAEDEATDDETGDEETGDEDDGDEGNDN